MSADSNVFIGPQLLLRAHSARFDRISIALHWVTAALVATQLTTAWLMQQSSDYSPLLLTTHRSIGVLTWFLVVARLVWRRNFAYLPPFPATMPKLQQQVAKVVEYGLYVLLLVQPITGMGSTLFHGRPFALFGWGLPALLTPNKTAFHMFQSLHALGAVALQSLIGLHAAGALYHSVVLRDGTLQRMLPSRPDSDSELRYAIWNRCSSTPGGRAADVFNPPGRTLNGHVAGKLFESRRKQHSGMSNLGAVRKTAGNDEGN